MLNVLKTTLVYTGIYFLFCIAWTIVLIGAQVFWKPVVAMFFIILAIFTFGYIRDRKNCTTFEQADAACVKRTVQDVMDSVKAKHGIA